LRKVYNNVILAKIINKIIEKFDLVGKVISIIINNISNNRTTLSELNKYIAETYKNIFFSTNNIIHIPCLAYIFQLDIRTACTWEFLVGDPPGFALGD
jgi:hypothetical protein